jgi:hypothetical protein
MWGGLSEPGGRGPRRSEFDAVRTLSLGEDFLKLLETGQAGDEVGLVD